METTTKQIIEKTLQEIIGICTRTTYRQFTAEIGMKKVIKAITEVELLLNKMEDQHIKENKNLMTKNRDMAKKMHSLKQELNDANENLAKAKNDLDSSQASFQALYEDVNDEELEEGQEECCNRQDDQNSSQTILPSLCEDDQETLSE